MPPPECVCTVNVIVNAYLEFVEVSIHLESPKDTNFFVEGLLHLMNSCLCKGVI